MRTVTLGPDGPSVPAIGQGTMGIGGFFSREDDKDAEHVRLLRLGIDLGLTVIDTAEVYGDGHAEELIGRAVAGIRDRVCIVTKFSAEHSRAAEVVAAAERSLRRLGTDHIDIYMPHWPNPQVPLTETQEAMDRLVAAGKVRWPGLSNFGVAEATRAVTHLRAAPLAAMQCEYSLLERGAEEAILPHCARAGVALMAYSPYAQGKLLTRTRRTEPLFVMAADYGVSPAQLALAWMLRLPQVLAIPKAGREQSLRDNAAALTLVVAPADLDALSAVFAPAMEHIAPALIDVTDSDDQRKVYKSLPEAVENRYGMAPSPRELSEEIIASGGVLQKPVKVRRDVGTGRYTLLDGRTKFWGWVIAYGATTPIPAIVEEA